VLNRRNFSLLIVFAVAGYLAATASSGDVRATHETAEAAGWFSLKGKVTRVVDGDTLIARIGRRNERVRLIGIDTPEIGACFSQDAKRAAQRVVGGRAIRLIGDRSQTRRDRYNRLLAYVQRTNGLDLGQQLLLRGYGSVYVFSKPFARLRNYQAAEQTAKSGSLGVWGPTCAVQPPTTTSTATATTTTTTATTTTITTSSSTTTTTASNCAASYPDVCIPPPPPDLDCGQISYRNFRVIYNVPSPDPHRFDGDRDGIGCES
jgi:micrococcal nuclease